MKSLEPYKNQSLAECYYVSPDGKKIIRNYTCHEVYPMTSAFDAKYNALDGVRTAFVLGTFLVLLVLHTTCKGGRNKRKTEIQIMSARDAVTKACRLHDIAVIACPGSTGFYDSEERRVDGSDHSSDLQYQGSGFWRKDRLAMQDHTCIQATAQWIVAQPLCYNEDVNDIIGFKGSTASIVAIVGAGQGACQGAGQRTGSIGGRGNIRDNSHFSNRKTQSMKQKILHRSGYNKMKSIINNIDIRYNCEINENENSSEIGKQFYDPEAFRQTSNCFKLEEEIYQSHNGYISSKKSPTMVHNYGPGKQRSKSKAELQTQPRDKVGYRLQSYSVPSPTTRGQNRMQSRVSSTIAYPGSPVFCRPHPLQANRSIKDTPNPSTLSNQAYEYVAAS